MQPEDDSQDDSGQTRADTVPAAQSGSDSASFPLGIRFGHPLKEAPVSLEKFQGLRADLRSHRFLEVEIAKPGGIRQLFELLEHEK